MCAYGKPAGNVKVCAQLNPKPHTAEKKSKTIHTLSWHYSPKFDSTIPTFPVYSKCFYSICCALIWRVCMRARNRN